MARADVWHTRPPLIQLSIVTAPERNWHHSSLLLFQGAVVFDCKAGQRHHVWHALRHEGRGLRRLPRPSRWSGRATQKSARAPLILTHAKTEFCVASPASTIHRHRFICFSRTGNCVHAESRSILLYVSGASVAGVAGSRSTPADLRRVDPKFDRTEKWAFKLKASFPKLRARL